MRSRGGAGELADNGHTGALDDPGGRWGTNECSLRLVGQQEAVGRTACPRNHRGEKFGYVPQIGGPAQTGWPKLRGDKIVTKDLTPGIELR
jgi:hypothetical protein